MFCHALLPIWEVRMMVVTLEEIKNYLRVGFAEDDDLLQSLLATAKRLCMDVVRIEDEAAFSEIENARTAVMYATAYLYEHREEADHHALVLTLRALLFGSRKEAF